VAARRLIFSRATASDAVALAALHLAVAADLTTRYGKGHWSRCPGEKGVLRAITTSHVMVARDARGTIVATLQLATKKPWAIDRAFFTPVKRPLYLLNMAVTPKLQKKGVGRRCLEEAARIASAWPAQSICLDAYDAAAGAGGFYARCGYREMGNKIYRGVSLVYYEFLVTTAPGRRKE
jgi:GNAT superfamily N-acetyltransferase